MIKRKILACILLFFFIVSSLIPYCCAYDNLNETDLVPQPTTLTLNAKAAYLVDANTGDVLYAMNETDQLYPASTTKIMTCYLTLKYGNLNDLYTLPDEISSGMDEDSSTSHLLPGEELYISELLQCLMISSANEAANALAIYISGSIDDFVDLMNEEAEALGCTDTHFENPNGLHSDAHYISAKDLSIITLAALQFDTFRNICGTSSATIRATNLSQARTLENTNYLLPGTDFPAYDYDGAEGVKTGHTTPAGYCLVSLASRNGHELLGVVLGASETTSGNQVQIGSFTESISLLDWGFENYDTAVVYQQFLLESAEAEAAGGENNSVTDEVESDTSPADNTGNADSGDENAPENMQDNASSEVEISSEDKASSVEASPAIMNESDAAGLSDAAQSSADEMISAAEAPDAADDMISTAADTGANVTGFARLAYSLQITSSDLVFLFAGCLALILLLILILICCMVRRKQVIVHEL